MTFWFLLPKNPWLIEVFLALSFIFPVSPVYSFYLSPLQHSDCLFTADAVMSFLCISMADLGNIVLLLVDFHCLIWFPLLAFSSLLFCDFHLHVLNARCLHPKSSTNRICLHTLHVMCPQVHRWNVDRQIHFNYYHDCMTCLVLLLLWFCCAFVRIEATANPLQSYCVAIKSFVGFQIQSPDWLDADWMVTESRWIVRFFLIVAVLRIIACLQMFSVAWVVHALHGVLFACCDETWLLEAGTR